MKKRAATAIEIVDETEERMPNFAPRLYGIILVVAALAFAGIWLLSRYAAMDRENEIRQWQDRLNLISESRADDISKWVGDHFKDLRATADNPSLRLYLMELQSQQQNSAKDGPAVLEEPAQKTYLRNMLNFTADRQGLAPVRSPLTQDIPANVDARNLISGLAVLTNDNQPIVATVGMPAIEGELLQKIANVPQGVVSLLDMEKLEDNRVRVGFVVPVFALQSENESGSQIGRIVALKEVDASFFAMLRHPGITKETLEAMLVRADGDNILYLSPGKDDTPPLTRTMPNDPTTLDAAFAVKSPGSFSDSRNDYRSQLVLMTSRDIHNTPWVLVVKISAKEALGPSTAKRSAMITFLILVIALVIAVVVAVWRNATYNHSRAVTDHFQKMAERTQAQARLLRVVSDNQSEAIAIVDRAGIYRFANARCAERVAMHQDDMRGKTLQDVLGAARAEEAIEANNMALEKGEPVSRTSRQMQQGKEHVIRAEHIPLEHIPLPNLPKNTPGVLLVEQDVTDVVQEREMRLRVQRQLTGALIKMVDKRDPFAANHSAVVAQIAHEVATSLELPSLQVETTRLAGSLMNIGKIVIPPQLLTSSGNLSEQEKQTIRESMFVSADLLKDVQFDGPVVETLRQSHEHWDGTGTGSLKGEHILITARIIAVVNAFIGMISPRSWRKAMDVDEAVKILLSETGTKYDQKVVVALVNFIENRGGRSIVKQLMADEKAPVG